ncbi:hypothetical protein D3C76_1841010 [compost metagenome]
MLIEQDDQALLAGQDLLQPLHVATVQCQGFLPQQIEQLLSWLKVVGDQLQ